MVKLIMLTGSFNCFIQSKQFSCNKWHNNYAHNLTRGQWQLEEWHTHLHKVQRTHLHASIHTHTINRGKKKTEVKSVQARWKNNKNHLTVLHPLQLFSLWVVNMICYHVLLFSVIHLLCQCTQRGNRNASKVADLLSKIFISRLAKHDWSLGVTGNHALCRRIWHDLETSQHRPYITIRATFPSRRYIWCV